VIEKKDLTSKQILAAFDELAKKDHSKSDSVAVYVSGLLD
jgi:hypothetical protein